MTKTSQDVCTHALRLLSVVAVGEEPSAKDFAFCKEVFEAEFDRVNTVHGFGWTFDAETVPDDLLHAMGMLVASKVDSTYMVQGPPESRAIGMLREYSFPDDRADSRDLDEDGTVTDAEKDAAKRAAYY